MTSRRGHRRRCKNADGSLGDAHAHPLFEPPRARSSTSLLGVPLFPWTPLTACAMGDANAGNFRYLNHFFETNLAQSTGELARDPGAQPGHPVGQHDRRRLDGDAPTTPTSRCAARDRREGHASATRRWARHVRARSACPCSTGRSRRASGAATPTRSSPASSAPATCRRCPRRLRDQLQRHLLAVEPRGAARGLRPHHRRRAHRALAADPVRPADQVRAALWRTSTVGPGTGTRCQQLQDAVFQEPPVRAASCGATSWRPSARPARRWSARRARSTSARPARCCAPGT